MQPGRKILFTILFAFSIALASFGEVAEEEVAPPKYTKFYHNGQLTAFIEQPAELLDTVIPEGVKWGTKDIIYDVDGDVVSSEQKTVDEFVIWKVYSIDRSKCIIMLAAMEAPTLRQHGVTKSDLDDWDYYLTNMCGIPFSSWMNVDEMRARIASDEYANGE